MTLQVKDAQNVSKTLKTTTSSNLIIPHHNVNSPWDLRVARGDVSWATAKLLQAENAALSNSVDEDIHNVGGDVYLPTSAEQLNVTSSHAQDTSAGTGAQTVLVEGLDASRAAISETVTMNGLSIVVTANSYLRVNALTVVTSGSKNETEGDITIGSSGSPSSIFQQISTGKTKSSSTLYSIPAGWTGFIRRVGGLARAGKNIRYTLRYQDSNSHWFDLYEWEAEDERTVSHAFDFELVAPAQSDVVIRGSQPSGSGDEVAMAFYSLLLTKDTETLE